MKNEFFSFIKYTNSLSKITPRTTVTVAQMKHSYIIFFCSNLYLSTLLRRNIAITKNVCITNSVLFLFFSQLLWVLIFLWTTVSLGWYRVTLYICRVYNRDSSYLQPIDSTVHKLSDTCQKSAVWSTSTRHKQKKINKFRIFYCSQGSTHESCTV
jgi:hypothetical protein